MKLQTQILKGLSSPYFYILFILNLTFLVIQIKKQKKESDVKIRLESIKTGMLPGKAAPMNLFPSVKLKLKLDTLASLTNSKSIILRLIKNDCQECEDSLINNTVKLAKRFGKQNVTVLVNKSYSNYEFNIFRRLHQFDFERISYLADELTTFDQGHLSYYFVIDAKTDEAQNVFQIQEMEDSGHTPRYQEWLRAYEHEEMQKTIFPKSNHHFSLID